MVGPNTERYDGLPFPSDIELVLAIKTRIEYGSMEAAIGLVQQYRERLLYHPESQVAARELFREPALEA